MRGASCLLKHGFAESGTRLRIRRLGLIRCAVLALLAFGASSVLAQSCLTSSDMDAATRTALTNAGVRYFTFVAAGDAASLRQNAIPSLAADFSSVEGAVKDNQMALTGAKAAARPPFLLEAEGAATIPRAEFYLRRFREQGPDPRQRCLLLE